MELHLLKRSLLLMFLVLGCETPMNLERFDLDIKSDDSVVYTCQTTGRSWELHCIQNEWQGSVGNCTDGKHAKT